MPDGTLEEKLQAIEAQLVDVEQLPATTFEIIGEETRERHWEAMLVYFLDPSNPHGFGTDILAAFLEALAAHGDTSLSPLLHDIDSVDVQSQVPTGDGVVDILLWNDDAWFICLELKVKAGETDAQTARYAQAPELGELVVDKHDGVGEYVYLAPRRARASTADTFVDITWEHVVPYFEDVLQSGRGQYPAKSQAQFADYLDTIKATLNMDEDAIISDETRLYAEYADTIDRLVGSFEEDKARVFDQLETAFFGELGTDRDQWIVNNRPETYINFAKKSWTNLPSGTTIEYEPHVKLDSHTQQIRLRLDIERGDKDQIRETLYEALTESERESLQANDWEFVDATYAYLSKPVPLDLESPETSINHASQQLHDLHIIVGPHLDRIVSHRRTQ